MSSRRPGKSPGGSVPDGRYSPSQRVSDSANMRHSQRKMGAFHKLRWVAFAILVAIVLGLIGFVTYYNLGPKPIEADSVSYQRLTEHSMEMTVRVDRDEPGRASVCVVRVRSFNGLETGRKEVLFAAGRSSVRTVVQSTRPPVTASVVGCSYNVPSYLSTQERPKG